VADEIAAISAAVDRSRSQIARKMISRGLAAYRRDGNLDEPVNDENAGRPLRLRDSKSQKRSAKQPGAQLRSAPRQKDEIDKAIDAALSYGGKPVSEADRKTIREVLEKQIRKKLEQQIRKESE